ncbi:MAG: hypothetical protein IID46_02505 [Planctomycetes bacterium]|nr:hypothetical protein [Planctomycetota bacterium]
MNWSSMCSSPDRRLLADGCHVNTSIVYLVAVLSTASAADIPQSNPVYSLNDPFETVIRSQTPGQPYEENLGSGTSSGSQTYVTPPMVSPGPGYYQPGIQDPFLTQPGVPSPYGAVGPYGGFNASTYSFGANGPQPYRMNRWISRYDFGILPKESTEKGLGNFGVFEFDAEWEYSQPTSWGWIFSFVQEFDLRSWEGPTGSATVPTVSLPGSVYRIGWDFELASPANYPWSIQLGFNPSINSDFRKGLSSKAWNFDARGILFFRATPSFMIAAGAGFWDRVNDRVIPYAGFVWTPNDRWEWRMVLPQPRVSYFLGTPWGFATWVYARAEYHVEAYQIQLETTGAREKVEIDDWRILMGWRNDNGWYSSFLEAGWVFGREVDYLNGTPGFDISSGFIARAGLRF